MDFPLFPWDRKRPRQNIPQAQNTLNYGGKIYALRAVNGLLFLREVGQAKTLAVATPLTQTQEKDVEAFPAIAKRALQKEDVARYVVGYDEFLSRTLPLFLRADGTGFCREPWNRDDLEFRFEISMHDWMEGGDETLAEQTRKIFYPQLHPQLSAFDDHQERELEWICGSFAQLEKLATEICRMENQVWNSGCRVLQVSLQCENEFGRAGVTGWDLSGVKDAGWSADIDGVTDQLALWSAGKCPPTRRFMALFDLVVDENTPTSLGWEYHDQGIGRCSNAPQNETISVEVTPPTAKQIEEARRNLRFWLEGKMAASEVERVLADDAPADLPKHQWFDQINAQKI